MSRTERGVQEERERESLGKNSTHIIVRPIASQTVQKETLTLLKDAVTDLMEKILKAAMQRGDLTEEDVKAAGLTTPAIDIASGDDMAVLSYDKFIDELTVDPSRIDTAVEAAFDRIDMRFLERLNERVQVLLPHWSLFVRADGAACAAHGPLE